MSKIYQIWKIEFYQFSVKHRPSRSRKSSNRRGKVEVVHKWVAGKHWIEEDNSVHPSD